MNLLVGQATLAEEGRDGARPSSVDPGPEAGGPRSVVARKTPAHQPVFQRFGQTPIIFLTVCAQERKPLFARPEVHLLLQNAWAEADEWAVGRYVVMPDHLHLFCTPGKVEHVSLAKWVHYWKSMVSRQWPYPSEQPVWQKSCWDTQLRRHENYSEKWNYVRHNPVRAGLCADMEDWPYQGEMHVLAWHD